MNDAISFSAPSSTGHVSYSAEVEEGVVVLTRTLEGLDSVDHKIVCPCFGIAEINDFFEHDPLWLELRNELTIFLGRISHLLKVCYGTCATVR